MKLIALYDRATEAYGQIITVSTRNEAVRSFKEQCNDPQSQICKYPTDYELWQLGEYNNQTGTIESNMEIIARAEDLKGN